MTIIKSVLGDFLSGIDLSQFNTEVQDLVLTVTVDNMRIDGDVLTITLSGGPSGADTTAIDGAITVHDPDFLSPEELAAAQAEVFGTDSAYSEDEAVRVRVSSSWQEVHSLQVHELETDGVYRVAWFYEWSADITNNDFVARVQLDDTDLLSEHQQEPKDNSGASISGSGTDQRHTASGFRHVSIDSGSTPYIDIDIRGANANYEVTIYRSRIEFWRIS